MSNQLPQNKQDLSLLGKKTEELATKMDLALENFKQNSAARSAVGKNISALSEQINSITSSLKEVQNISMQVKILSLNAAIEAARAGAAGKGFAVVATEIGKLSESTDHAVIGIENSIQTMSSLLDGTIKDMQTAQAIGSEFNGTLAGCVDDSQELNDLLAGILNSVQ